MEPAAARPTSPHARADANTERVLVTTYCSTVAGVDAGGRGQRSAAQVAALGPQPWDHLVRRNGGVWALHGRGRATRDATACPATVL